jgi:hypothetical protein
MKIYTREGVKPVEQKRAGFFSTYTPDDFPKNHFLVTNQTLSMKSGVFAKVPLGYHLVAERTLGKGLKVEIHLSDEQEVIFSIQNISEDLIELVPGDFLCNFFLVRVKPEKLEVSDSLDDLK